MIDLAASIAPAIHAEGTIKTADDLDRYRRIIRTTQPQVIVEMGTHQGGSALWFARYAPVITVDVNPVMAVVHPNVTCVAGSSTDPEVIERVHVAVKGRRALVTLDSDHSSGHVTAEMEAYHQLVQPGGYMVVEDTILRWVDGQPYNGTPADAVDAWLPGHTGWANDLTLEDAWPTTQHPGGWLRRLR